MLTRLGVLFLSWVAPASTAVHILTEASDILVTEDGYQLLVL